MTEIETSLFDRYFSGPPAQPPLNGRELRDSGMEECLAKASQQWKADFKSAIESLPIGSRLTIESVIESLGGRPCDVKPAAVGALTMHLAKKGLIERSTEPPLKSQQASRRNADAILWIRTEAR